MVFQLGSTEGVPRRRDPVLTMDAGEPHRLASVSLIVAVPSRARAVPEVRFVDVDQLLFHAGRQTTYVQQTLGVSPGMPQWQGRDMPLPAFALPFTPELPVTTARLCLRAFSHDDFAALLAFHSLPDAVRYVPFEPRTPESMSAALDSKVAGSLLQREGDHLDLAVTTHDGLLVGDLVLILRAEQDQTVEVGYLFDPAHGGQGYATEAVRALLGMAFGQLGARRAVARIDVRNLPSRRLCERLGLRQEAHLIENEWVKEELTSEVDYALLAREWDAQQR